MTTGAQKDNCKDTRHRIGIRQAIQSFTLSDYCFTSSAVLTVMLRARVEMRAMRNVINSTNHDDVVVFVEENNSSIPTKQNVVVTMTQKQTVSRM